MKLNIRILTTLFIAAIASLLLSCLQGDPMNTPPGGAGAPKILMSFVDVANDGTDLRAGLANFQAAALVFPPTDDADTVTFWVTIQGGTSNKDINVSIAPDKNALRDNFSTDSIAYSPMPDSLYRFINTSGVIKAGTSSAEFQLIVYPSKIDNTKNFMLAVQPTNDGGFSTSTNNGHIYFHSIGSPLGGAYKWNYTRYNAADTLGGADITITDLSGTQVFAPDSPTTIEVQSGYGVQNGFKARYVLSFTNVGGVLSNFKVSMNTSDVKNSFTANQIALLSDAVIVVADPVKKHFRFTYKVTNSAGKPRSFTDDYVAK